MTLDRFCGSGITAVNLAAASIMAGMEDLVVAGGTEMMSSYGRRPPIEGAAGFMDCGQRAPARDAIRRRTRACAPTPSPRWKASPRQAVDELALVSQQRADAAINEGRFDGSLVPVHHEDGDARARPRGIPAPADDGRGPGRAEAVVRGASPTCRWTTSGTTFGGLILQVYPDLEITHVHHAGNSSGVVDGAAALLLASPDYAKAHGLKPRARVVAMANIGDCPTLMLNAPVPAASKVLAKAGLTLDDIDLFEINEAFAVVAEKFIRDLDLDRDKVNVNGGAIALGHPIGATGSMLIGTVLDELERRDLQRGLVTMCAAGGMAPAIIIERMN